MEAEHSAMPLFDSTPVYDVYDDDCVWDVRDPSSTLVIPTHDEDKCFWILSDPGLHINERCVGNCDADSNREAFCVIFAAGARGRHSDLGVRRTVERDEDHVAGNLYSEPVDIKAFWHTVWTSEAMPELSVAANVQQFVIPYANTKVSSICLTKCLSNSVHPTAAILCTDAFQSMYVQMLCGLCQRQEVLCVGAMFASDLFGAIRFLQVPWEQLAANMKSERLAPRLSMHNVVNLYLDVIVDDAMHQYISTLDLECFSGGLPMARTMYVSAAFGSDHEQKVVPKYRDERVFIKTGTVTSADVMGSTNLSSFKLGQAVLSCVVQDMGHAAASATMTKIWDPGGSVRRLGDKPHFKEWGMLGTCLWPRAYDGPTGPQPKHSWSIKGSAALKAGIMNQTNIQNKQATASPSSISLCSSSPPSQSPASSLLPLLKRSSYQGSANKHEAELAAAAAQPLPDDDDDLIE